MAERIDHGLFTVGSVGPDDDGFLRGCARWRDAGEVPLIEAPGFAPFQALTGYADVREVSRAGDVFLSGPRSLLVPQAEDDARLGAAGRVLSLVEMDGEAHRSHRALLARYFHVSQLERLRPTIAGLASEAVAGLTTDTGAVVEAAGGMSLPYALRVLLAVIGVPASEYPRMYALTCEPFTRDTAAKVRYLDRLLASGAVRHGGHDDDLIRLIATGIVAGRPLTRPEQIGMLLTILTAGHETVAAALTGGLHALAHHPEQFSRLSADPALLDGAVEEVLRWTSPITGFMRTHTATTPYDLRGHAIPAGGAVLLCYPSANRDPAAFDDPDTFDVVRRADRHLAFGAGEHRCLGAPVARLALRELLAALTLRVSALSIVDRPTFTRTRFLRRFTRLPLHVTP